MLEFLYRIFIGHNHKWVQVERALRAPLMGQKVSSGIVYIMRCEVCGKMKQQNIN